MKNRNKKFILVFAEKTPSDGTYLAFSKLFGIRFNPSQEEFKCKILIDAKRRTINIIYMNLSKCDDNSEYRRKCASVLSECKKCICFESCIPRLESVGNNIRILRNIFGNDKKMQKKLVFLFKTERKTSKNEKTMHIKMLAYEESKCIKKLPDKVFDLDYLSSRYGMEYIIGDEFNDSCCSCSWF